MNKYLRFMLLGLMALAAGRAVHAQSASDYSITEFKLTNSSAALPVYTNLSTKPIYNLSFKITRRSTAGIYDPAIYLVGYLTGAYAYDTQAAATLNYPSGGWVNNGDGTVTALYTGTIRLGANDIANNSHTGLQAVIVFPGTGGPGVSSNTIALTPTAQAGAVTVTSLRVNGATSIPLSATATNVTYTLTLSKDRGFSDDINVYLRGSTAGGALSALINASLFQAPTTTVSPGATAGWTESGTRLLYTVNKTFSLSSANVGANDDRLVAQAFDAYTNTLLGSNGPVLLTRPTVACSDDVLLQNTSSLTGTVTSGHNIVAGANVNAAAAAGDVVVPAGTTVAFAARNEIQLAPGVSIQPGAAFSATIDGAVCSVVRFADDPPTSTSATADAPSASARTAATPLAARSLADARAELLTLYPSPAQTTLTVGLPLAGAGPRQAIIYNAAGAEVLRANLPGPQTTLDVHALPVGLYQLRTSYEGQALTRRFSIGR